MRGPCRSFGKVPELCAIIIFVFDRQRPASVPVVTGQAVCCWTVLWCIIDDSWPKRIERLCFWGLPQSLAIKFLSKFEDTFRVGHGARKVFLDGHGRRAKYVIVFCQQFTSRDYNVGDKEVRLGWKHEFVTHPPHVPATTWWRVVKEV